ncbi:MAG TPA: hypothetical protein VNQ77_00470 [Frankiaceae bacterium]|nr:hypothetical protein [Frankiaceae bacterium]
MRRTISALALAGAALFSAASPAVAQDPIHVSAHASFDTVSPGGFQSGECAVENTSGERLLVVLSPSVTYADGEVQRFRLNQPPTVLGPGEAFILSVAFAVPEDAAPGTATFTCEARAVGAGGGGFTQTATDTFEVT